VKYLFSFIAGLLLGTWIMVKPKPSPEKREHKVDYRNARGAIPWEEWSRSSSSIIDIDPEQIVTYVSPDVEILGSWDRVLTNDEKKRVNSAGEDRIRASFEDTQPIKASDG